jgi:hypothetical protein
MRPTIFDVYEYHVQLIALEKSYFLKTIKKMGFIVHNYY